MGTNLIRSSFQQPSKLLRSKSLPLLSELKSASKYFSGKDLSNLHKPHSARDVFSKTPPSKLRESSKQSQKKTPAEEVLAVLSSPTRYDEWPVAEPTNPIPALGKVQATLNSVGNFFKKMWGFFTKFF